MSFFEIRDPTDKIPLCRPESLQYGESHLFDISATSGAVVGLCSTFNDFNTVVEFCEAKFYYCVIKYYII